ncbi:hypothetical protein BO70DRAFT_178548 [Aspergillus heteromorphus CBS 117.55]|uniref:Uncharacterized protein n=1 Tax=Aspergillus heteromorphus CBS 117.55 TaxID=1448321 RepID=A0A317WRD0_9EURO|nr:uncharacterized protein BO70DRAFT_178548 [Aspergillus heteromorphus CBS 117.55]PWY88281.1 hypothetical protein BO70DRAFT_178548 [Aspergillus heteromorphus CBS 117.55]
MSGSSLDIPYCFKGAHFPQVGFKDFPDGFCTLDNRNLFPREKFIMLHGEEEIKQIVYGKLEPALLLISRIILHHWASYSVFLRRKQPDDNDIFITEDHLVDVTKDEVVRSIQNLIPDFDFNPDMNIGSSCCAETALRPDSPRDLVVLNYDLISVLLSIRSDNAKISALVFLAVCIGHGIAHVLEFRMIRGGKLNAQSRAFLTPPGLTCREAGTAWESNVFGGKVVPICSRPSDLLRIQGLCINGSAVGYKMMKINEEWMHGLFNETHWQTTKRPTQAPLDVYADYAHLMPDDPEELSESRKEKTHGNDVRVQTGSPTKMPRFLRPQRRHGCKRVLLAGDS